MEDVCPDCKNKNLTMTTRRVSFSASLRARDYRRMMDEGPSGGPSTQTRGARGQGWLHLLYAPEQGLVTEIDQYNRESGGRLPSKKQAQFYRMRSGTRGRASPVPQRGTSQLLFRTEPNPSYLVFQTASGVCRAHIQRCVDKGLIKGRLIESIVAAVLYAKCRECGVPRTLAEIAEISGVKKKEIGRRTGTSRMSST